MADINFDCPHCGHNLDVNERGAGLTVACPECSKNIKIPASEHLMSNIKFTCGSCRQSLEAPPDMAGQLIDCPACNKPTEIPFAPRPTPPTPTRPTARSTPIHQPPSQRHVPGKGGLGFGRYLTAAGIAAIIVGISVGAILYPIYTLAFVLIGFVVLFCVGAECDNYECRKRQREIVEKAKCVIKAEILNTMPDRTDFGAIYADGTVSIITAPRDDEVYMMLLSKCK